MNQDKNNHDLEFAEIIKKFRDELGLTQEELAKVSDIPVRTIRSWENKERSPKAEQIAKLAKAFGVTTDTLLGFYSEDNDSNDSDYDNDLSKKNRELSFNPFDFNTDKLDYALAGTIMCLIDEIGAHYLYLNECVHISDDIAFARPNLRTISPKLFVDECIKRLSQYKVVNDFKADAIMARITELYEILKTKNIKSEDDLWPLYYYASRYWFSYQRKH